MFERFTDRARRVITIAGEERKLLNHSAIGTEHLLLGMIHEGEGVAAKALEALGVELEKTRHAVQAAIADDETAADSSGFTPRAKKVLELSLREALQLGHNYIGTEHMLLGLAREGEGVAVQVLFNLGVTPEEVRQQVIDLLRGYANAKATGKPATMSEYLDTLKRAAAEYGLLRDRYVGEAFGLVEAAVSAMTVPASAEYTVRFSDGTERIFSADRMVRDESSVEFYRGQELVGVVSGFSSVIKAAA